MMEVDRVVNYARGVSIFCSYAHRDRALLDELVIHLGRSHIRGWSDREILPGQEWEQVIDARLEAADIILLLVSPYFIASEYCSGREMKRALERHATGEARVVPIILRPAHWKEQPFSKLQVLPSDGKPVTSWPDPNEAFFVITEGIRQVIGELLKKRYVQEAEEFSKRQEYEHALSVYEQAILLTNNNSTLHNDPSLHQRKADVLFRLNRPMEALAAYDDAIRLEPHNVQHYLNKGKILVSLDRFDLALEVYNDAIKSAYNNASLYINRGDAMFKLKRFEDALKDYEQAIVLEPSNPVYYKLAGDLLFTLQRFEKALNLYEKAISLESNNASFYVCKGDVLFRIKQYNQALIAYEQAIRLDPDNPQIWRNKGKVLFNLANLEEALKSYEFALHLDPYNAFLYKEKGDVFLKLNRLEEALAAYQDAVNYKPNFGLAYLYIANIFDELASQAYMRLKRRADQAYEKAHSLGVGKQKIFTTNLFQERRDQHPT